MGKVSNLRQQRKRKARAEAGRVAAENRVRFGRTPEQRQLEAARRDLAQRRLDQARREPPAGGD